MCLTSKEIKRFILAILLVICLPIFAHAQTSDPSTRSTLVLELEQSLLELKELASIDADKTLDEISSLQDDIERSGDKYLEILSLYVKGRAYNTKQYFGIADSILNIASSFSNESDFIEINLDSKYELAYAMNYNRDQDSAKELFLEVLNKSRELNYDDGILKSLGGLSQYYRYGIIDIDSALLYADTMLTQSALSNSEYHQAIALNLKAIYNRDLNNLEEAIYYFNETLKVRRSNNWDHMLLSPLNEASTLYFNNSNFEMSYEFGLEAHDLAKKQGNLPRQLAAMLNVGRSLMNMGQLDNALEVLHELEKLAKLSNYNLSEYLALTYLAYTYKFKNKLSASREYFEKVITVAKKHKYNLAYQLASYSDLEISAGNLEKAISLARLSLNTAYTQFDEQVGTAHITLARAQYEASKDSAIYHAEKYLDLVFGSQSGSGLLQTENRRFLGQTVTSLEVGTWYLKLRGDLNKAFEKAEQGKSRALINSFKARDELQLFQNDPEISAELDSLAARANNAYSIVETTDNRDSLRFVIKNYELEIEGLISKASRKYNLEYTPPPTLSLSDVQGLLDDKSAMIHYSLMNEELMIFQITKDSIKTTLISDTHPDFRIDTLITCIEDYTKAIKAKEEIYKLNELSKPLIDILFPNDLIGLEGIDNLILIPGGIMNRISFGALRSNNQYLIERFNIKYLPSASILPLIDQPHRIKGNDLYSYSNTNFTYSNDELAKTYPKYASLPYAGIERQKINNLFDSKNSFISAELAEPDFKSTISDYKFIHLATHSIVNNESPNFSKLIFTNKLLGKDQFNDGHLNSIEISSLKINADLTVLSACSTGDGLLLGGEGLQGLQRSFLIAGSSAVVVSLWEVYDSSTSDFMEIFYKELLENQDEEMNAWKSFLVRMNLYDVPVFDYRPKALRDAKLTMIKHPYYSHPVYWAPFIYVGR